MDIMFYSMKIEKDYIAVYHDCTIKPCIDDGIIINNKLYVVKKEVVDYDKNTIHVFLEREY